MNESFKPIADAFVKSGINNKKAEFSITEYSLNTSLSFKFNNCRELLDFLEIEPDSHRLDIVKAMFVEKGIDPDKFFYVNFFRPKVAEL